MGVINRSVPKHDHYDLALEKQKLSETGTRLGLIIPESFLATIKVGDIVEIYSVPENVQIHSNDEFKSICSYTPQQMAEIPFMKLFWRADEDHFALMKRASEVVQNEERAVSWNLPDHELVESLHPRKRTFEMAMGMITPCFDQKTKERRAWASTLQVALIFEWDEDLS